MTFRKDRAQILAVCDFKPADDENVADGIALVEYRSTIRQIIESSIANVINELDSVSGASPGTNLYINALEKVEEIFGVGIDGGPGSQIFQDIVELNELIKAFSGIADTSDFAKSVMQSSKNRLAVKTNAAKDAILPGDTYYTYLTRVAPRCDDFHQHIVRALSEDAGFLSESVPLFSSTKTYAQLIDLIGSLVNEGSTHLLGLGDSNPPNAARLADTHAWSFTRLDPYLLSDTKGIYRLPKDVFYKLNAFEEINNNSFQFEQDYGRFSGTYDRTDDLFPFGTAYLSNQKYKAFVGYATNPPDSSSAATLPKILFAISRELAVSAGLATYEDDGSYIIELLSDRNKNPTEVTSIGEQPIRNRGLTLPGEGTDWLSNLSPFDRAHIAGDSAISAERVRQPAKRPGPYDLATSRSHVVVSSEDTSETRSTLYTAFEKFDISNSSITIAGTERLLLEKLKSVDIPVARRDGIDSLSALPYLSTLDATASTSKDIIDEYTQYIRKITSIDSLGSERSLDPVTVSKILLGNEKVQDVIQSLGFSPVQSAIGSPLLVLGSNECSGNNFARYYTNQDRVHTTLFAIEEPRFLSVLEEYCFRYFISTRTLWYVPSWKEFVNSSLRNADLSFIGQSTSIAGFATNPSSVGPDGLGFNGEFPAVVAWALYHFCRPAIQPVYAEDGIRYRFYAHDLFKSLDSGGTGAAENEPIPYSMSNSARKSPFEALASFYEEVLNMTANVTEDYGTERDDWFVQSSDEERGLSGPNAHDVSVTRASGLDARELFFLCFQAFRRLISAGTEPPRLIAAPDRTLPTCYSNPTVRAVHPNGMAGGSIVDALVERDITRQFFVLPSPEYDPEGSYFEIQVPTSFGARIDRMTSAYEGTSAPVSNIYEDLTLAMEHENKAMIRAVSLANGIMDARRSAIQAAENKTIGPDALGIIKEYLPEGQTPAGFGPALLQNLDHETVSSAYKTTKRTLPFVSSVGEEAITSKAFTPLMRSTSGIPGIINAASGRIAALKSFLKTPAYSSSNDNRFDPNNARIFCVGFPKGIFGERFNTSVAANIEEGAVPEPFAGLDNTIVRVAFSKLDNMLPGVRFKPMEFVYDPSLFVAPDGYKDYIGDAPIEESLSAFKFHRTVVDVENGSQIGFQTYEFDPDTGFVPTASIFDPPASYIESLSPEVARQLAYTTVMSDLLAMYVEIVNGLSIGDETFPAFFEEEILDLAVDEFVGNQNVEFGSYLSVLSSLESFTLDQATALEMLSESYPGDVGIVGKRVKTMSDAYSDETVSDDSAADFSIARAVLGSILFSPKFTRQKILTNSMMSGTGFFLVDPDQFRVSAYGEDGAPGNDPVLVRRYLDAASLIVSEPEGGEDTVDFIVKSGNSEDATIIGDIIVQFIPGVIEDPVNNEIPGNPLDALGGF
jgi:hypothetical protein